MSKHMWCNACLSRGEWVDMRPMDGYFICPNCPNESWPDQEGKFVDRWVKEQKQTDSYVSLSLPEGVRVHGGSDPSGRTPDLGKKKSTQQIYKQLFKET